MRGVDDGLMTTGKVIGMQRQLGMQQSKMGGLVMQLEDALKSGETGLAESLKMQINGLK